MRFLKKIPPWIYLFFFAGAALFQVWLVRDVVMGDAFIHFVFARGINEGQPFFYNGEFSAGSTSPLWSILLAFIYKLTGDGIIGSVKIFASFFVALSVLLTFNLGYKVSKNKIISLASSFLVATSFVLSFWAAKGMETPFYVCLVLGSFLIYLTIIDLPSKKTDLGLEILLGLLLGLGILARPEMWFFSLFIGIPLLLKRGWRVIFSVGIPAFLIFCPYYFWLYENTQQFFPSSMARILRARQWALELHGIFFSLEILKILFTKLLPLTPFAIFFFCSRVNSSNTQSKTPDISQININSNRLVLYPIYAWLFFHLIFFSLVFPTTEGYRYILAALPFFYLIALLGIWKIRKIRYRHILLALALIGSVVISTQQLLERMDSVKNCEQPFIDKTRRNVGLWIRENTNANDLIAMKEVDQSAFYGKRKMLSVDGTLDTKAIPFVKNGDQLGFFQQEKPDYFILEEEMYREYPNWGKSNVLPLINSNPQIEETQTISEIKFTLLEKIKSGDAKNCQHFSAEYHWWIFGVEYAK